MQETQIGSLGQEDPLEKGLATHSNILAWRIIRTEESDGLWQILSLFTSNMQWVIYNICFGFKFHLSMC